MKPAVLTAVGFAALVLFSGPAARAQETVQAAFDDREWKLGFENYNQEKKAMIKEFVPEGQTVDTWDELVTLQFFEGLQNKITVAQFLQKMQAGIQNACPGVNWRILSSKDNEAVYQWSIRGCKGQPDQTEIARVFAGHEGMHVWHYAVKDPDLAPQKKKEWIDRLNQFRLKS